MRQDQESIRADAQVAMTDPLTQFGEVAFSGFVGIQQDKVVASALHLDKWQGTGFG
jgi:hypothetical protein